MKDKAEEKIGVHKTYSSGLVLTECSDWVLFTNIYLFHATIHFQHQYENQTFKSGRKICNKNCQALAEHTIINTKLTPKSSACPFRSFTPVLSANGGLALQHLLC